MNFKFGHMEVPEQRPSMREQLAEIFRAEYPDVVSETAQDREYRKSNLKAKERIVSDAELQELFEKYGINVPEIREVEGDIWECEVASHFSEDKGVRLPEGYAYVGGAARALLLRTLGIDVSAQPRDIDVVRISEREPREDMDHEVSERFMPDDYKHGYGVREERDLDGYFGTRDLTVNEIIATDTTITATRQCVLDTIRRITRITEFEKEEYEGGGPKILAKMLRFYAEAVHQYGEGSIAGIETYKYEESFISPFWLALHLDRAFERGTGVAEQYVEELKKRRQIPEGIEDASQAAEYLRDVMRDGDTFYYRHAPEEQFTVEDEWLESDISDISPRERSPKSVPKNSHWKKQ